jgi:hypothetical protein
MSPRITPTQASGTGGLVRTVLGEEHDAGDQAADPEDERDDGAGHQPAMPLLGGHNSRLSGVAEEEREQIARLTRERLQAR